jgi:hypothetical protein
MSVMADLGNWKLKHSRWTKETLLMRRSIHFYFAFIGVLAAFLPVGAYGSHHEDAAKQYLDLRHYEFASVEQQAAFEHFLAEAAIPALNRQGIKPVGVFKETEADKLGLYVLLPHSSLKSVGTANTVLLADDTYLLAGAAVLESPKKKPAYQRFESNLLLSFDDCPKVEVPSQKATRVFQLRIYESHNTTMAKRKIEMFNERGGEIAIFREAGLHPVFFGETIAGKLMPNLTYMVGFDDAEAQKAAWSTFGRHPEWKRIRSLEYFKGTVSNITNIVLRPAACSQI